MKTRTRVAHFQLVLQWAQARGLRKWVLQALCRKQNKLHLSVPGLGLQMRMRQLHVLTSGDL